MKVFTSFIIATLLVASAVHVASAGVLFQDNFSADLSQWEQQPPSYWSIISGSLDVNMPAVYNLFSRILAGDPNWTNYRLDFDVLGIVNSSKICYVRYRSETEGYFINLRGPVPAEGDLGSVRLFRLNGLGYWPHGSWDTLVITPFLNNVGHTYHVAVEVMGPEIVVYVGGTEYIRYNDTVAPVLSGRIGFTGFTGADGRNRVRWDNVTVIVPTVKTEPTTWGRVKALYRGE